MNKNAILVTHQFLEESDFSHESSWKINVFKFTLKRYRELNPEAYIILVGHGRLIPEECTEFCDWHYWHDELIQNEINWGHPECVNIGLQHCEENGIKYVTKTRLDSIILQPNITNYCKQKINNKENCFVLTNFSHNSYGLMDLFYSGTVDTLRKLYKYETWRTLWPDFYHKGGTFPLAFNFYKEILGKNLPMDFDQNSWIDELANRLIVVSPAEIKWLDLRKYNFLINSHAELKIQENSTLIANFYWKH